MKPHPVLLALVLATAATAQEPAKPAAAAPAPTAEKQISVTEAKITAPLVLKAGAISQPDQEELDRGGKAIFKVNVPKDGTYVIAAVVNAPAEDANSYFINFDKQPEDPLMIWDIPLTNGFQERIVSWRGNGDANYDEFTPKKFKLTAGEHTLILIGREAGTELKSIALRPVAD